MVVWCVSVGDEGELEFLKLFLFSISKQLYFILQWLTYYVHVILSFAL